MTLLTRRASVPRTAALAAGAIALLWAGGFLWFIRDVTRPAGNPGMADGIVVLTGGAERIATGLRLLQEGCCERLLISGVGHGAELAELLHGTGVDPDPLAERISLGRAATNTAGNADEAAAWAHANHLHSLLVVTAFYHMPRALTELARTAPDLVLHAVPVTPARARHGTAFAMLSLLAEEYTKYLGSAAGLTFLQHGRDTSGYPGGADPA